MNRETLFAVAPDHPALDGHFPGQPILPGVVLLDEAVQRIAAAVSRDLQAGCELVRLKLLQPALPGDQLSLEWQSTAAGDISFRVLRNDRALAEGLLRLQSI